MADKQENLTSGNRGDDEHDHVDESETCPYDEKSDDPEPEPELVDFESNGLLWLPPEPEDEDGDRDIETDLLDDDIDGDAYSPGEWGHPRSSTSFGSGEYLSRDNNNNNNNNNRDDMTHSKEEDFPCSSSLDHQDQSISVFLSTRCVWKGTVCEWPHLVPIEYHGSSDKPLGQFLRDHLFDQHEQGSLTISVKKIHEFALPGEGQGKIWMWRSCLECPRVNGFPPATRREVMPDADWDYKLWSFSPQRLFKILWFREDGCLPSLCFN